MFYTDFTLKFFAKKADSKQFNNNTKNYFLTILFILVFLLLFVLTLLFKDQRSSKLKYL